MHRVFDSYEMYLLQHVQIRKQDPAGFSQLSQIYMGWTGVVATSLTVTHTHTCTQILLAHLNFLFCNNHISGMHP